MKNLQSVLYFINEIYYNIRKRKEDIAVPVALNYQLSIFGEYSIIPSPEIVTILMNALNQSTNEVFLPNIVNTQQIEVPSNKISLISNLGFVTQDQRYSVVIQNNRIDVSFNKMSDYEVEMDEFYDLAERVIGTIIEKLKLTANRLAANILMLTECQDLNKINTLGRLFLNGAKYYENKMMCEWSTKCNAQSSIRISDREEKINTITDLRSTTSTTGEEVAVLYHVDINTLQQNTRMRFVADDLKSFISEILPIVKDIIIDLEGKVSNA